MGGWSTQLWKNKNYEKQMYNKTSYKVKERHFIYESESVVCCIRLSASVMGLAETIKFMVRL